MSALTKLQQLQLLLDDAEQQKASLQRDVTDLRRDLKNQNPDISLMISNNLETLCTKFIEQASASFYDFEDLCLQKKESSQSVQEVKYQVKEHLEDVFRIIGREPALEQLQLWKRTTKFDTKTPNESDSGEDDKANEQNGIDPKESISGLIMGLKKPKLNQAPPPEKVTSKLATQVQEQKLVVAEITLKKDDPIP